MSSPIEFKVVVAGPFGVGKTALITNVSNVPVVGTEVPTSGDEADQKESTTVGLEYGLLSVSAPDSDINLLLYGTPGQRRFRFMLDVVSAGADGIVVLVDASRPDTWDEAAEILAYYLEQHAEICVVGANRADTNSAAYRQLVDYLGAHGVVPVVPCQVTEERSARDLMVALVERILDENDDPATQGEATSHGHSTDRTTTSLGSPQANGSQWALTSGN